MSDRLDALREMRARSRMLRKRKCGTCSACCIMLGVKEIDKDPGTACRHLSAPGRCDIYQRRPTSCREYHCLWREGAPFIASEHRPDRLGVIFDLCTDPQVVEDSLVMVARPVRVDVYDEPLVQQVLDQLSQQHVIITLKHATADRTILGPAHLVEDVLAVAHERVRRSLPVFPDHDQENP